MPDRPAVPTSFPPPSFPVYGLDSPFAGPRWLELFGDPPDGAPHWVSLSHQSADGRSLIQVTTYTRRATGNPRGWRVPTDTQAAQYGASPLNSLASQGTTGLTSMTLPVLSLTRPPGFLRALVDHAQAAADAYVEWPTVDWRVDGVAVPVPMWSFADGWTGFTDATDGVYMSVVGIGPGTGPPGLAFAALRDSGAYHFDLHGPLSLDLVTASRGAAGVSYEEQPLWQPQEWHPDQLRLMRDLGPDAAH